MNTESTERVSVFKNKHPENLSAAGGSVSNSKGVSDDG